MNCSSAAVALGAYADLFLALFPGLAFLVGLLDWMGFGRRGQACVEWFLGLGVLLTWIVHRPTLGHMMLGAAVLLAGVILIAARYRARAPRA